MDLPVWECYVLSWGGGRRVTVELSGQLGPLLDGLFPGAPWWPTAVSAGCWTRWTTDAHEQHYGLSHGFPPESHAWQMPGMEPGIGAP